MERFKRAKQLCFTQASVRYPNVFDQPSTYRHEFSISNFKDGTISLYRGTTKNGEPRKVFMPDDVKALLSECCAGKGPDDFLFTWKGNRQVLDFRQAWSDLTVAAGVSGLRFHDLRRSAVRGMIRAGVTERVMMQISGHRTASVFGRYDITDETDLAAAAKLIQNKHKLSTNPKPARKRKVLKSS
jgi:integrase